MPTATERPTSTVRRQMLAGGAAWVGLALARPIAAAADTRIVTTWSDARGNHHLGLIGVGDGVAQVLASRELPTRAHGLACAADGSVLVVARRPGDWLLRWHPDGSRPSKLLWAEADRRFNGHVLTGPDPHRLYTTEIELETGEGRLVERDAATLTERDAWSTHGLDPHDMEWLPDGQLLVANGGIRTLAETGRAKLDTGRMDPSLVRIDPARGALTGQWRLADHRLSLRHLAAHASGRIGVALQAEHEDASDRATAPLLACFDPHADRLEVVASAHSGAGYAGDIAASADGWLVSCPRDGEVLALPVGGGPVRRLPFDEVCALAAERDARRVWMSGKGQVRCTTRRSAAVVLPAGCTFDNHAVVWPGTLPA